MVSKNFSEFHVNAITLADYKKIEKTLTRPLTGTRYVEAKNLSNFGTK